MAYTTIKKPSDYFNTKLYTGNGSTGHAITGVGFQPDLLWLKPRSTTGYHRLFDAVRGAGYQLYSNETNGSGLDTNQMSAFNSDGFTLGNETGSNANGTTFVSWNWLANGAGSANTDGSISSTVSANTTSGFSIVQYSGNATAGATVGHGLGSVPKMVIVKKTNGAKDWNVYHVGMGATKGMYLNLTNAEQTHGNWNNTTPTNTVFSIGSDDQVNGSGQIYIAYCFAEKTGYSKFGSYTGNGNADGPFIYTGFKPSFILMKRSDTGNSYDNWYIFDNKRDGFNPNNKKIAPNISDAESSDTGLFDLLSNGFKLRTTNSNNNGSGGNFIYMAFAEEPLVGDNPATAR
jgi:hypothetical protein